MITKLFPQTTYQIFRRSSLLEIKLVFSVKHSSMGKTFNNSNNEILETKRSREPSKQLTFDITPHYFANVDELIKKCNKHIIRSWHLRLA